MRHRLPSLLLVIVLSATTAAAQEGGPDASSSPFPPFERGDGILSLALGTSVPLGFYDPNASAFSGSNMNMGIEFALSYLGFLNDSWLIGGEAGGSFMNTVGGRSLFMAPIALRVGYAIPLNPIIILPSAGVGVAIMSIGSSKHVDPIFKLGSSFLYRATLDLSYALDLFAHIVPQFYADETQNRTGFFIEATLALSYHL